MPAKFKKASFPAVDTQKLRDWQEMRFGLFLHWGLYSLTAGYWKGRRARNSGHIMLHEQISVAEWGELAQDFNPVKFDADAWVQTAIDAGMKYLVVTTKHHDGLAMYDSPSSDYDLFDRSPFKRDPIKELADACHTHGVRLGFYYSLGRDWEDPDCPTNWPHKGGRSNTWDYPDEDAKVFNRYFQRKVKPQVRELLTQYGEVDIIWFDTPELISPEESAELRELIHSLQPNCIINDRIGNKCGDYVTREQSLGERLESPWETCVTMARHWNYDRDEANDYKSAELLVHQLVETASKGGNYLLNIGPTPEGELPAEALTRLSAIGDWMKVNGEGIYGSKAWIVENELLTEGQDKDETIRIDEAMKDADNDATSRTIPAEVRFTQKADCIYAFISSWQEETVTVKSLSRDRLLVASVCLMGCPDEISWSQTELGLEIRMPPLAPTSPVPIRGFRIERASE